MDNLLANSLSIVIQPKQNFHYRYVTELDRSHGVLLGRVEQSYGRRRNGVIEDIYPTVKLKLPADGHLDEYGNKRKFKVLCTLHSYNETGPQSLSPHLLMKKGIKPDRETYGDLIYKDMDENEDNPLERSFQLKDYLIVRMTLEEYQLSLPGKRRYFANLQLPLEFDRLKGDLNINDVTSVETSGILNVCLGFTIFEWDFHTKVYRLYRETIYSDNIFYGDQLKIRKLCNTKGPIQGGVEINMFANLESGYTYFVRMFKYSSDMTREVWQAFVPIVKNPLIGNAGISYTLPAGPPNEETDEIEVMIEIFVDQSTYKSKPVKFWYLNTNDNESGENSNSTALVTEVLTLPNLFHAIDPNLKHHSSSLEEMPIKKPKLQETIAENDMQINYLPQAEELPTTSSIDTHTESLRSPSFRHVDDLITCVTSLEQPEDYEVLFQNFIDEYFDILNRTEESPGPYHSWDRCESVGPRKQNITNETPKKSTDISALISRRIDQICNADPTSDINIKGLIDRSVNTIFHDALMYMDTLQYLCRLQENSSRLKELILKARNTYRQNLLHYACMHNKPSCFRPLVNMGIALHEQDSLGRTPLHIAIEHNNEDCRLKFQSLIQDHSDYPSEVKTQLIKMFQVYSHKGHTVLHAAVIENLYELVEVMLKFCKSHNLDILQYEALGNGDSIAHLIVRRNLVGMSTLIREYVSFTVQNYMEQTVFEVQGLSTEMFRALTIQ